MIIAMTTFKLDKPVTREQAQALFLTTAPKYQGVAGLVSKHYVLSEDGATAGGIYVWNSKQDAEAMYTEAWRSFIQDKYGMQPIITYFDNPVVVDNLTGQIVAHE